MADLADLLRDDERRYEGFRSWTAWVEAGDAELLPALLPGLGHPAPSVRLEFAEAVVRVQGGVWIALPALRPLLRDPEWCECAAEILQTAEPDADLTPANTMLLEECEAAAEEDVRFGLLHAVGEIGIRDPSLAIRIARLLDPEQAGVGEIAIEILEGMGEAGRPALPYLETLTRDADQGVSHLVRVLIGRLRGGRL